jgi:hypothetical protein
LRFPPHYESKKLGMFDTEEEEEEEEEEGGGEEEEKGTSPLRNVRKYLTADT